MRSSRGVVKRFCPIDTQIAVAEIIGQDEDDIGRAAFLRRIVKGIGMGGEDRNCRRRQRNQQRLYVCKKGMAHGVGVGKQCDTGDKN